MSDVNPDLNRVSLPPNQVLSHDFLKPNEIEALKQRKDKKNHDQGSLKSPLPSLEVLFIDLRLEFEDKEGINLTMWMLSNSETKTYVLRTTWGKLHLAIVVVKRAGKIATNQSGGSSSKSGNVVDINDECGGQGSREVEGSNEVMDMSAQKIHLSEKQEDKDF
ncbi:hypothetical protein Pyn_33140 [Prunus yedoensis var. nudiflora]|uniref:Uncharacterized protein n=1 Tax=Prunus yedoensis var. nudiflora TaxID=2094558 RepID=A0A314ZAI2_PRUYE|nr:hypothetical protein Pyn_33140 [Prunus yedoensis var. nudiflora]